MASRRSPRTIATYVAIVSAFAESAHTEFPTRTDIEAFLARPRGDGRPRAPATRNQELAALRAFAKFALRELGWTTNPTDGIPFVREPPRDPPVLGLGELRRLFAVAAEEPFPGTRARDIALLAVLSQAGLRVHELVALNVDQVDLASATLVAVRGKGGTIHDVPLNAPTCNLLIAWLGERCPAATGESALFLSRVGRRLSIRGVQRLVAQLRARLGTAKHITPHTLRHTAATLALTLGADVSTVADLLRHADLNTTRRYLHLVDERQREAVRRLGTAIPADLLTAPDALPRPPVRADSPAMADNIRSLPPPLDVQHGLGDIRTWREPLATSQTGVAFCVVGAGAKEACR